MEIMQRYYHVRTFNCLEYYEKQPVFKVALKTLTDIEVPLINQHNISKLRNHSVKKRYTKTKQNKTWKNMTCVTTEIYD